MVKYSILIPSRNGAKYLPSAIRTVLMQSFQDFELIVSVNHSSDNSLEVLKQFNDPRLKVIIPPRPLSMTKHFEWLLQQASGEWIALFGDDDGLMPYFFQELEKIQLRWPKIKVISSHKAFYNWDGVQTTLGPTVFEYNTANKSRIISAKFQLFKALCSGFILDELPMLYTNSVVHHSVIHSILEKSDTQFFHDLAPDVYSGVAICASTRHYLRYALPLFWHGRSTKSTGLSFILSAKKQATLEMQARAEEFMKMQQKDQISTAEQVDERVWSDNTLTSILIYASLNKLPFKSPFSGKRWVDYLVHASFDRQIKYYRSKDDLDQVERLKVLRKIQIERNKLSPLLLTAISKLQGRIIRKIWNTVIGKRPKQILGEKHLLYSEDHQKFPTIDSASLEVYRLYQQS